MPKAWAVCVPSPSPAPQHTGTGSPLGSLPGKNHRTLHCCCLLTLQPDMPYSRARGVKRRVAMPATVSQLTQWTYCVRVTEHLTPVMRSSYCQPQLCWSWGQKVKDCTQLENLSASNIHNQNIPGKKMKPSAVSMQHSAESRWLLSYKESQSFPKVCLID